MNFYPVSAVACAFEYGVAIIFVVSIDCGSFSHLVTWSIADLYVFHFLHSRNM